MFFRICAWVGRGLFAEDTGLALCSLCYARGRNDCKHGSRLAEGEGGGVLFFGQRLSFLVPICISTLLYFRLLSPIFLLPATGMRLYTQLLFVLAAGFWRGASAHDHHGANMNFDAGEPIGAVLKLHILLMAAAFGVLFPVGLVLGLRKNKWHVPVQSAGGVLAIVG
ncbi:hypothetical protein LPJ57_006226, partial [Coemansia sp. RSA 486]